MAKYISKIVIVFKQLKQIMENIHKERYMRFGFIICLCLVGLSSFASTPKGCPQTRSCVDDKNCTIYASKHNCHGQCEQRTINLPDGNLLQCPSQCLCAKA